MAKKDAKKLDKKELKAAKKAEEKAARKAQRSGSETAEVLRFDSDKMYFATADAKGETIKDSLDKAASADDKAEAPQAGGHFRLGTPSRPYPMYKTLQNAEGEISHELGVLRNGKLRINSERTEAEMLGLAFRDMPSPSMLSLFLKGHVQRETDDPRKVEFMMGEPGTGKSFLANLHAKMRTGRGALLVDCGGRDLGELLYEIVLDYDTGKSLYDEIDAKLAKGEMSKASITLLKEALGHHMVQSGDRYSIDWKSFDGSAPYDPESDKDLDDKAIQAKRAKERAEQKQNLENAVTLIEKVAKLEGLGKGGDSAVGLTSKEGPIIRAWRENRPLILDEYNKAKPGTDDALQILWQVFNGEMDQHTVKGGGGKTFTFKSSERPDKFFVTLTGNLTKDGYSTRSLSSSAYQRLQPQEILPPSVDDWQHRLCQKLTGVPISTIYKANKDYWDKHEAEFTDYLTDIYYMGREGYQGPPGQYAQLLNWQNVLKASEQLALFYDMWAQVTDPNSKLYENSQGDIQKLLNEVDEEYGARIAMGLRHMLRDLDVASIIPPEVEIGGDIESDDVLDNGLEENEPVELRFGTRLSAHLIEKINDTAPGDKFKGLRKYLLKQAGHAGLYELAEAQDDVAEGEKRDETETRRSAVDYLIADLLDIDPNKKEEIPENIEEIHTFLCDYLRQKFPEIAPDALNQDIISPSKLQYVLSELGGQQEVERLSKRSGQLILPNLDLDVVKDEPLIGQTGLESSAVGKPYDSATKEQKDAYKDILEEEKGLEEVSSLATEELVDAERFLISLAIPAIKTKNLDATFADVNIRTDYREEDSTLTMLLNKHESGLAANVLACKAPDGKGGERDEYFIVLHDSLANGRQGKTLITGTIDISDRLKEGLEKSGVIYVNRNAPDAQQTVDEITGKFMQDRPDTLPMFNGLPSTCHEEMLTGALSLRIPMKSSKNPGSRNYDLPHQDITSGNNTSTVTDEARAQHKENLVALLTDSGQYLEKTAGERRVFMLTSSPDIDSLKHVLRHFANDNAQQQKSAGASK